MVEESKVPIPTLINNEYTIEVSNCLGKGSFGYVYGAHDKSGNKYAAKIEIKNHFSLLPFEHNVLASFKDKIGFPKVFYFNEQSGYYVLIMELLGFFFYYINIVLGKNLEEVFYKSNRRFSVKSVAILGLQMLNRLQVMHEKGYVHRDIKPENV
jgi:serine/threonine protein kinase